MIQKNDQRTGEHSDIAREFIADPNSQHFHAPQSCSVPAAINGTHSPAALNQYA